MPQSQQIIFGIHAVKAIITQKPNTIIELIVSENHRNTRLQSLIDIAKQKNIRLTFTDKKSLDAQYQGNHQGAVAICKKDSENNSATSLEELLENTSKPLLLILDGVTDPHNLGACLRTADASGVNAVIIPKDKSATVDNPTVSKVACGAAESIPVFTVTNLARTLRQLQDAGVWLVGTSDKATQSIYETDFTGATGLIMGAEGKGMRSLTAKHCDFLCYIPMQGYVSSLNVSVATGVCLFEAVRQRQ